MKFGLSCLAALLMTVLHLSSAGASPLSTGTAPASDAANPVVQTQLNMTEYTEVAQAPMVKVVNTGNTDNFLSAIADKFSKSENPLSTALILFGFALAAIGWMGRKEKKNYLVKD
ncbi:MAG: hypothetical protein V7701_16695 [Sneathiella sp.]